MSTTITPCPPRLLSVRPQSRSSDGAPSEAGWATLVALRPAVLAFLRNRCRDEHQAEDLTHDTILRAARHSSHLSRVARPRAWAIQIAANVQRDHARKESRHKLSPPDHPRFQAIASTEPIPGDSVRAQRYDVDGLSMDGDDLIQGVRDVWDNLPSRDRAVLSTYYFDEGTTRTAAVACGIAHNLVKVRLFRARRRLEVALRARLARGR